jgi:hypothetical protein
MPNLQDWRASAELPLVRWPVSFPLINEAGSMGRNDDAITKTNKIRLGQLAPKCHFLQVLNFPGGHYFFVCSGLGAE